jgi:serine/threonine protein kinase/Flp pilus assembly protein TadD
MIGQVISHYRILEELGRGGMGVVYKAHDEKLDRTVAIKVLSSHLSDSQQNKARFLQEAKTAAALNHRNILGIHEINEEQGSLFLVTEFVDGKTLKDYLSQLKSGSGFGVSQSIAWMLQIAEGLRAAHQKGIVHRDIKSQNIMIDAHGHLRIMDFGLAKLKSGSGITKTGTSLGTLSYMSPEQAQGIPADHRSDIWSLGVVFFEMLTSDLPFKAEHEAALLYLVVNEDPPVPSDFDRRIPPQVDQVLRKFLAKKKEDRYQSMDEVVDALRNLEAGAKATTPEGATKKAIAVLPFDNISSDKDNEYFGDGLTEELIVNLSRLKEMEVVSRSTSLQYKGTKKDVKTIGRELRVRYILEGSVRKFQDNIRIAVQLVDVETDRQLWAESYKGRLADVFDIQESVSKQIVDALMLRLSPKEKVILTKRSTLNAEAFDYNLKGRNALYRLTKNSVNSAIQFFQKAIDLDPRYASAHAGLGEAYATIHQYFDSTNSWLDKAIESSLKALMYDPSLSEAYAALGLAYFDKKQVDEAITATQKAIELDPNNHVAYWILGRIYYTSDRSDAAAEMLEKAVALNPGFYNAHNDLLQTYDRMGKKDKFSDELKTVLNFYPQYLSECPDDARAHMYYAVHLAMVGRNEDAKVEGKRALELNPEDSLMMYNAACLYSRLGDKRLAVETLKNAVAGGQEDFEWIKRDPDLNNIREEPEFKTLVEGR